MDLAKKLVFQDPPPKVRPRQVVGFEQFTGDLMAHPGQWAIIGDKARAYQVAALKREYPDFEFTYRGPADGRRTTTAAPDKTIWARYRGTEWSLENMAKTRKRKGEKNAATPAESPVSAA